MMRSAGRALAITALVLGACGQQPPTGTPMATAALSIRPSATATATPIRFVIGCPADSPRTCRALLAAVRASLRSRGLGRPDRYVVEPSYGPVPHEVVHACFATSPDVLVDVENPRGQRWEASISDFVEDDYVCR
jgi:hypothetical protein